MGTSARMELEKRFGKKVYLELFVKVKAGWRQSAAFVEELDWRRQLENLTEKRQTDGRVVLAAISSFSETLSRVLSKVSSVSEGYSLKKLQARQSLLTQNPTRCAAPKISCA